jgi:hypothetical protein
MSVNLILYTTSHCHLCEQAELLLRVSSRSNDITWASVEISDKTELLERYAIKIPVLKRMDNDLEITWPFTAHEISNLIKL